MNTPSSPFEIEAEKTVTYLARQHCLIILLTTIWIFGVGLLLALLYFFFVAPWFPRKQVSALKYWLDGSTLRIDQGVYFLKRKSIPLDRVTDIVIVQGPLMRACDIWALQVQTAGAGAQMPEATLLGLREPEVIRDMLMKARDDAARGR